MTDEQQAAAETLAWRWVTRYRTNHGPQHPTRFAFICHAQPSLDLPQDRDVYRAAMAGALAALHGAGTVA